jgi:hypothetical protein
MLGASRLRASAPTTLAVVGVVSLVKAGAVYFACTASLAHSTATAFTLCSLAAAAAFAVGA